MKPRAATCAICMIIPPSVFLLDERIFMTLGILKVAAVLEQAGLPIELVDLSGIENYEDAIRAHVQVSEATVYALTVTTPQLPVVVKICRVIRFYDDELNVNPKMIELMRMIVHAQEKLGTEFRLRGFVKAQLFTE